MVLLIAIFLGLFGGLIRLKITKRQLRMFNIRSLWLVFLAYVPQFFAFYFPPTQVLIPDNWIPLILIGSQTLLIVFAWVNRKMNGFWLLGFGLMCNFTAILLNGGFMPILPETIQKMFPLKNDIALIVGERVGFGKDILLLKEDTNLWFLGDVFVLPAWFNYPLAFSFGDILISTGAFWLFWEIGQPQPKPKEALS